MMVQAASSRLGILNPEVLLSGYSRREFRSTWLDLGNVKRNNDLQD